MPRLSYANVAATAALVLATGGGTLAVAQAVVRATPTQIKACAEKQGGELRRIPLSKKCKRSEKAVKWNVTGPPGTPAAKMWAMVRVGGSVAASTPGVVAENYAGFDGLYYVYFPDYVDQCVSVGNVTTVPVAPGANGGYQPATLSLSVSGRGVPVPSPAGSVDVGRRLVVSLETDTGAPIDSGFGVAVFC